MMDLIDIIEYFTYNFTFLITPRIIHHRLQLQMRPHFTNDFTTTTN